MKSTLLVLGLAILAGTCIAQKDDNLLNVHLIPHSHDDYGWIFPINTYYNESIPFPGQGPVREIINSVVSELQKGADRKFVQVEIGFLNMWWESKSEADRLIYKKLVESGQIEIINGGWTMHDEATPYFEDMIENMFVGHQWVKEKFGVIPSIGWQLDPFGHQSTNAALYSQMGFNGQWFARIDYQDFEKRKQQQELEMIWCPPQNSGEETYIFSAVNYQHYSPPKEFYFEIGEIVTPSNIVSKADKFVTYFKTMSRHFRGKHLLHTMGEDFAYSRANMWYDSMDKLITYINSRSEQYGMKILYSTPSLYLKELQNQNSTYPINKHDFFPYADKQDAYWTGYFTSRPSVKGFTKDSGRYLQAIRNIFAMESILNISPAFQHHIQNVTHALENFEQQVAMMMHHDAVTGTQRQTVVTDYIRRLNDGYEKIRQQLNPLLQEYARLEIGEQDINYIQCNWNATISQCSITQQTLMQEAPVLIMIHNPSATKSQITRIKIPQKSLSVINNQNKVLKSDIICSNPQDLQDCDLYFIDTFQGYSNQYYKIIPNKQDKIVKQTLQKASTEYLTVDLSDKSTLVIHKKTYQFSYSIWELKKDPFIKSFKLKQHHFEILYNYYTSKDAPGTQSSGAYIFRPNEEKSMSYSQIQSMNVFKGQLVTVVTLVGTKTTTQLRFQNNMSQTIFEVETLVDSIDINDYKGKEVVMLINTNIQNGHKFYTDSNGLELQERNIDQRPTWNLQMNEKISGNYYPIGAIISIEDKETKQRCSIVNDRSQGGTSLREGQIEIMIHRRILRDDGRGVSESLNERDDINLQNGLAQKVRHYIIFEKEGDQYARLVQNHLDASNQIFLAKSSTMSFHIETKSTLFENSPLRLNKNPYLRVYLRRFEDHYTLRLYNIHELSGAEFKLAQNFKIIDELTLTANQSKKEWTQNRYKWQTERPMQEPSQPQNLDQEIETNLIKIKPMQLRVFKIQQLK